MTLKKPESLAEARAILEGREIDFGAHAAISWLIAEVEGLTHEVDYLNKKIDEARKIVKELQRLI